MNKKRKPLTKTRAEIVDMFVVQLKNSCFGIETVYNIEKFVSDYKNGNQIEDDYTIEDEFYESPIPEILKNKQPFWKRLLGID